MHKTTLKRHFKSSYHNLIRNRWMTVASVSAVTVTLLMVGLLMMTLLNLGHMADSVENNVQVRVMLKRDTTKKEQKQLAKKIKAIPNVKSVTYSSRQNELEQVVKHYGNTFKTLKGDKNPLSDVFVVKAKEPRQTTKIVKQVEKYAQVSEATNGGKNAKQLFKVMGLLRKIGFGLSLVLLLIALFLIANTIRITILSRKNEIEIMQLVGATNAYVRGPFILEGMLTGILGAIIPMVALTILYRIFYGNMAYELGHTGYELLTTGYLMLRVNAMLVVLGGVIGSLGAMFSMRRFLKID